MQHQCPEKRQRGQNVFSRNNKKYLYQGRHGFGENKIPSKDQTGSESNKDVSKSFLIQTPEIPSSVLVSFGSMKVRTLVDTGSELTLISKRIFDSLQSRATIKKVTRNYCLLTGPL